MKFNPCLCKAHHLRYSHVVLVSVSWRPFLFCSLKFVLKILLFSFCFSFLPLCSSFPPLLLQLPSPFAPASFPFAPASFPFAPASPPFAPASPPLLLQLPPLLHQLQLPSHNVLVYSLDTYSILLWRLKSYRDSIMWMP